MGNQIGKFHKFAKYVELFQQQYQKCVKMINLHKNVSKSCKWIEGVVKELDGLLQLGKNLGNFLMEQSNLFRVDQRCMIDRFAGVDESEKSSFKMIYLFPTHSL